MGFNSGFKGLNIIVVENQTLLLSCIGAKNCCQNAIISILFPSSKKKTTSSFKYNAKLIFKPNLYFLTDFLASHEFHFSRKIHLLGGADTWRLTGGYNECKKRFSHAWKWPNCRIAAFCFYAKHESNLCTVPDYLISLLLLREYRGG